MSNINYDEVANEFNNLRSENIGINDIKKILYANFSNPNVLDLGCGTGFPIGNMICKMAKRFVGVDNSKMMLEKFRDNISDVELYQLEMIDIGRINGTFDLIYGWGSVCHLSYDDQYKLFEVVTSKLNINGIFAFTSGEHEEQCTGSVGILQVNHFSLGKFKYKNIMKQYGLEFMDGNYCSGNFYLYQFRKQAQRGDAPEPAST